jgi:hypothetical protein
MGYSACHQAWYMQIVILGFHVLELMGSTACHQAWYMQGPTTAPEL